MKKVPKQFSSKVLVPLCVLMLSACNNSNTTPATAAAQGTELVAPVVPEEIIPGDLAGNEEIALFDQAAFDAKLALLSLEEEMHLELQECSLSLQDKYSDMFVVYHGDGLFDLKGMTETGDLQLSLSFMQDIPVLVSTDANSDMLMDDLNAIGALYFKETAADSFTLTAKKDGASCDLTFKLQAAEEEEEQAQEDEQAQQGEEQTQEEQQPAQEEQAPLEEAAPTPVLEETPVSEAPVEAPVETPVIDPIEVIENPIQVIDDILPLPPVQEEQPAIEQPVVEEPVIEQPVVEEPVITPAPTPDPTPLPPVENDDDQGDEGGKGKGKDK